MRLDDATLIERARQGSADALSTLYRRYSPLAWQWAYGITGQRARADDFAQDAVLVSLVIPGSIVVPQAGERVTIEEDPSGRGWRYVKLVETDERGNWSATGDVFASMRTTYRAVWRGARSSPATVAVRPAVVLRYRGNGLVAMVPAASSLAGRKITFQVWSPAAGVSSGRCPSSRTRRRTAGRTSRGSGRPCRAGRNCAQR